MGAAPIKGLKGAMAHIERLETAFFQISSLFNAHKDLNIILEAIARECLNCLTANRSTIFFVDPKSEILTAQFTQALDPRYEKVGLVEEKEVAKKTFRQGKPLLLGRPEDFSDFFKYEQRENKITSLLSAPLLSKGKAKGVLSLALINESYSFDEKSLQFFSSFANFASTAVEMVDLLEEAQKRDNLLITYEENLDNILNQLQGVSQREQQRIDTHIVMIQAEQKIDEREFLESKTNLKIPWVEGRIIPKDESGIDRREDERIEVGVRVEFDEEHWSFTKNLSNKGAFVLIPSPLDLGDEFLLKLCIPDGGEFIAVACKVVWTNKYGKESKDLRRGMGIRFLELKEEDQNRIEEFIQTYKAKNLVIKNGKTMIGV